MLSYLELKPGACIVIERQPYMVLESQFLRMQQRQPVMKTKMRNLMTGRTLERSFQPSDAIEEAEISKSKAQYLYKENDNYFFMDLESYDQFFLAENFLGNAPNYLIEGTEIFILNFNNKPLSVELPIKMKLKVAEAPPGIKGDTASGGGKLVTLETGLKITAPLFINAGDEVIVNTEKGEYVSRS